MTKVGIGTHDEQSGEESGACDEQSVREWCI
jgi:hypothetical protein